MAYNKQIADQIRQLLSQLTDLKIQEKIMFKGLIFMVNNKMCLGINAEELMIRFDPSLQKELALIDGFHIMKTKHKIYPGYGYVNLRMIRNSQDLEHWIKLCLDYNSVVKVKRYSSRR